MTSISKTDDRCGDDTHTAPHEIRKRRGLSLDEERELACLIANGDVDARNRLVQANLGLVVRVASDYKGRGLEMDDLIGEGNLGLIRAAEKFDPSFTIPFGNYASYWIKEKILGALSDTSRTIRLPRHTSQLLLRWRRAERTLCGEWGRMPKFEDTAAILELSPAEESRVALAYTAAQLRASGGHGGESGHRSVDEALGRESPCETRLDFEEEWAIAQHRLDQLDRRERAVVSMRYGLESEPLTLLAIGRRFGVTRECVRQIEIRAMRKLKAVSDPGSSGSKRESRSPIYRPGYLPRRREPLPQSRRREVETQAVRS